MSKRTAKRARKAKVPKPVRAWMPLWQAIVLEGLPRPPRMLTLYPRRGGSIRQPMQDTQYDYIVADARYYKAVPHTPRGKKSPRC